jgi:hypothetical protein
VGGELEEVPMKRLMFSSFAAFVLLAAATTTMLWSHSPSTAGPIGSAAMISPQGFHVAVDVNKLPVEDFEDQSLVYSIATKH